MTGLAVAVALVVVLGSVPVVVARRRPPIAVILPSNHPCQPGDVVTCNGRPMTVVRVDGPHVAVRAGVPASTCHALVAFAAIMAVSTVAEGAGWIPTQVSGVGGLLAGLCLLLALVTARRPQPL